MSKLGGLAVLAVLMVMVGTVGCAPKPSSSQPGTTAATTKTAEATATAPAKPSKATGHEPIALADEAAFDSTVLKASKPVMVDFWATWCGPCRKQGPIVDKLAGEYAGKIVVAKLDIDKVSAVADKYKVQEIPTLMFFKNGKEVGRQIGLTDEASLRDLIKSNLGVD